MAYEEQFDTAIRDYWRIRQGQRSKQEEAGVLDTGLRTEVTGGKQMGPLTGLVAQIFVDEGFPEESVHFERSLELPGYYRPTKQWDLLVVHEGILVGVVELKSIASSFGNNLNNRIEEAVGSADDLLTAYREGAFGATKPWLGYLFMIADEEKSRNPTRGREPHFPIDEEFRGASYQKRAEVFCRRLVLEQRYDAACFVVSDASAEGEVSQPATDMNFSRFVASIRGHARYIHELLAEQ